MASVKRNINIDLIELNEGQMYGLPKNPRWIRDARFEALKKSIEDAPEMLDIREIIVYPLSELPGHEDKFIVIGGNMRLRACKELGYKDIPCKVLDLETPVKKLREYVIKDNEAFGQNDYEVLANEWDADELTDYGMELDYLNTEVGDPADYLDDPEAGTRDGGEGEGGDPDKYSRKIQPPTYEITGEEPDIDECVDMAGVRRLLAEIDASGVSEDQKEMLRVCAYRHAVIHFDKMAEYYAHQKAEMQDLMENSALVIIDYDKALEHGFVNLTSRLLGIIENSDEADERFSDDETTSAEE